MKEVYLIIALLLVWSCRQDSTKQNQELLLGEWYPIEDTNYTDIGLYKGTGQTGKAMDINAISQGRELRLPHSAKYTNFIYLYSMEQGLQA